MRHLRADETASEISSLYVGFLTTAPTVTSKPRSTKDADSKYYFLQRPVDVALAAVLLIVSLPLMAIVIVLVSLTFNAPAIEWRLSGQSESRTYRQYRFRVVGQPRNRRGQPLTDTQRAAWFSRPLHISGLADLPYLFNVLRGDLSLFRGHRCTLTS